MTQCDTPDTQETKLLTSAADTLSKFFAARGVAISQDVALEALSSSLGADNWSTLRDKLRLPVDLSDGVFMVDAIYTDNDQNYSDCSDGISAIHAAILVQMERLHDGGSATEVGIVKVEDRRTGKTVLCPDYSHELNLVPVRKAIEVLCKLAAPKLGAPLMPGAPGFEEWDRYRLAIEFWEALTHCPGGTPADNKNAQRIEELNNIYYEMHEPYERSQPWGPTSFTDAAGVAHDIDVLDLLQRLVTLAESDVDLTKLSYPGSKDGVFEILQVKELLAQAPALIRLALEDYDVQRP